MVVIILHFFKFVFENWYTGVFEVTNYESELRLVAKILNFLQFVFENWYRGPTLKYYCNIFEIADYKLEP